MAGTGFDKRRIEWPTVIAIAAFWVALAATMLAGKALPTALTVAALAVLGGFYMSLQHEVIHGHPTPWRLLNKAFVGLPLGLTEPFSRYRESHLAHHASDLTNPVDDPESHYVTPDVWHRAGRLRRAVLRANRTLAARLTIGPLRAVTQVWTAELRRFGTDRAVRSRWALHVVGVAAVIVAVRSTGVPLWVYLLGFVFGGASLTSLRSFVEHSAQATEPRSAIVESNWFFGLLFLNNNLHFTHHLLPGASWYRLPQLTRDLDAGSLVAPGAGRYRGYLDVARRHLLHPFCQPVNPLLDTIEA